MITASLSSGWIEGIVTDDRNQPVSGAAVTAQGRDLLIIETDNVGRFQLRGIPAGTYLLRVQGRGFAASRREFVQVVPSRGTHFDVQLRRAAAPVMAPGGGAVLAAGVGLSSTAAEAIVSTLPTSVLPVADSRGGRRGAARSFVGGVAPAACQALGPARDDVAHRRRLAARRRGFVALARDASTRSPAGPPASAARRPPPC